MWTLFIVIDTIPVPATIFELASANLFLISFLTLCLCHYVPIMSLNCVVHTEDIKHHCEFFFHLRGLAVI